MTLEFKGADIWDERAGKRGAQKAALPAIVAFANAYGGVLVLGMREEHGPPGVAAELQPVADVLEKLEALQRAASDAIDPPLQGLVWKAVMAPGEDGRGVIVARAPPSQLAPHGFGKPPEAYVRRFANSEPMTMRDLHNVFWESRARQERVKAIRVNSSSRMQALRSLRDAGEVRLYDSHPEPLPRDKRGLFTRCSAIFQDRLDCSIKSLKSVTFQHSRRFGLDVEPAVASQSDRLALVDGVHCPFYFNSSMRSLMDGTVDWVGFCPGSDMNAMLGGPPIRNVHDPRDSIAIFDAIAFAAYQLRAETERRDAAYEVDMTLSFDFPAFSQLGSGVSRLRPASDTAQIGPFLIASKEDFANALGVAHVAILRAFGYDCETPNRNIQNFSFLDTL